MIIAVGGWAGNQIDSDAIYDNTDLCIQQHIYSSITAAHIASQLSVHYSLNVFTGSAAVLHNRSGNESMISYTICKSAIHSLVRTLGLKHNGLPANSCSIGIAPLTMDTPNNRKFMSDCDFTSWTKRELIAELIVRFSLMQQYNHHIKHNIGTSIELDNYQFQHIEEIKHIKLVNGGIYTFDTINNKTQIEIE